MNDFAEEKNGRTVSAEISSRMRSHRFGFGDASKMARKYWWVCIALICLCIYGFFHWQNQKKTFAVWSEEVRLSTGETIVIVQKRRFEFAYAGGVAGPSPIVREAWISIALPATSPQIIAWHENLLPMSLDVVDGKLYVLSYPPTRREFVQYNKPLPAYLLHIWSDQGWQLLPLEKLPSSLKSANLLIARRPPPDIEYMDLITKNSAKFNGDPYRHIASEFKRFSPESGKGW